MLILAPGSWGDVSPALRIASDLISDGHAVTMVVHADYAAAVESAGCTAARFTVALTPPQHAGGDSAHAGGGSGHTGGDSGPGARGYLAHLREYMMDHAEATLTAVRAGAIDVVLTNPISPYGHDIAEALGIPSAEALLQPSAPSRAYPPMIASAIDFGPLLNRQIGRLAMRAPAPYVPAVARVREQLGLPAKKVSTSLRERARAGIPIHHGISPIVLPRPSDWPAHLSLDGFWWPVEDEGWTAPAELSDFLAAGPPPVLVTMGSIAEGSRASAALSEFVSSTRHRVIVQGANGHALAEAAPGRVVTAGQVPHSWLLPQVATTIHQAGAGITAACLRAGIPGIALPQHTDQFFWARTATRLGAGLPALSGRKVTPGALHLNVETATGSSELHRDASAAAISLERAENEQGESTLPLRRWIADSSQRRGKAST
ncbi:UDP:flavonoid glycosyltransferase YjiC, YdhE family [Brevibacterium sandarakinum]|uniref:UDP:flavonoid glycosyltransferase YjiC, YdhE family n=1 Tax=Brevibacterium sandarakinum TaxID=629680 RepID=A0A1H1TNC3_BRESA|nr:UDP:flavonoid glycosyltransferase YjiC, YdhE family [Brevibacterium sandarakinum]